MDVRLCRSVLVLLVGWVLGGGIQPCSAATYRTKNFVIEAPTAEFARQVGEYAELYRKDLALEWVGREMPNWSAPCPVYVKVGTMGAGGSTTFSFDRGQVHGWNMNVQGSEERILDSVLPHEINHTIFACYFRRPLPRWADEGAASLIEHASERKRLQDIHSRVMGTPRKITLQQLLTIKEYPKDMHQVLALYAEGHSLADYLIQRSDKPTYLAFLQTAHEQGWDAALEKHYQYRSLQDLERQWDGWVMAGSPTLRLPAGQMLAQNDSTTPPARPNPAEATFRGQSTDDVANAVEPAGPAEGLSVAATVRNNTGAPTAGRSLAEGGSARVGRAQLERPVTVVMVPLPRREQ